LIVCSAVLTGARNFVAISEWAAEAPQEVPARLGARTATALAVRAPPSGATIRRIIKDTCPGGLADLLGHDPAGTDTLALDGKSACGSRIGATPAAHLLAPMTGIGMTVTQLRVPEKTDEITCFAALLDPYDLQGLTVTGDALHTQRDHARFLVHVKKAHYAFTVKRNQKNLHEQLRTLPWKQAAAKVYDRTTGHGRKETRTVQALTGTDLGIDFPYAAQAARVVRHRTDTETGKAEPGNGLRHHRPDQPPGIPGTHREDLEVTLADRKQAPLRPRHRLPRGRLQDPAPGTAPRTWPPSVASPSTNSATPATPTSPSDSAPQPSTPTSGHWPSSDSTDRPAPIRDQTTLQSPCPIGLNRVSTLLHAILAIPRANLDSPKRRSEALITVRPIATSHLDNRSVFGTSYNGDQRRPHQGSVLVWSSQHSDASLVAIPLNEPVVQRLRERQRCGIVEFLFRKQRCQDSIWIFGKQAKSVSHVAVS
jgi:hypothetical protein